MTDIDITLRHKLEAKLRRHAPGKRDPHGQAEGVVSRPDQLHSDYHASTVILIKYMAAVLTKQYGGYMWAIQPNEPGEVINIFNLNLHNEFGFVVRMIEVMNSPQQCRKLTLRAGADILDIFGAPRRYDPMALNELPRDPRGRAFPNPQAIEDPNIRRRIELAMKLIEGEYSVHEVNGTRLLAVTK